MNSAIIKLYMKYSQFNKYINTTLTIAVFYCLFSSAYSQPINSNLTANIQPHQNIINDKLNYYNNMFKDIQFIHLDGGNDWHAELDAVFKLLDDNAVALDYEHPKELQQDLVHVTIERLKYLVENNGISSTLFRVGDKSKIKKSNLCIVTLNPEILITHDSTPLQYMLNYTDTIIKKIHPSKYIDSQSFIKYSLDHEVFHCLNSLLIGGAPITFEVLGGEYNQMLRESAADAFSFILHLKENGKLTSFARNMVHIRALSIFNNDPNHNTLEILLKIIRLDIDKIKLMNVMDVISLSINIANETVGSYSDFRNQYALELQARRVLGNEILESEEKLKYLEKINADSLKVEMLIEYARYFYMKLFTDSIIDLEFIR